MRTEAEIYLNGINRAKQTLDSADYSVGQARRQFANKFINEIEAGEQWAVGILSAMLQAEVYILEAAGKNLHGALCEWWNRDVTASSEIQEGNNDAG